MSDSSDDMEFYSGFFDSDDNDELFEIIKNLQMKIQKIEKYLYGLDIKLRKFEKMNNQNKTGV